MAAVARPVTCLAVDGSTHTRHPLWSKLTWCERAAVRASDAVSDKPPTCPRCLHFLAKGWSKQRGAHRTIAIPAPYAAVETVEGTGLVVCELHCRKCDRPSCVALPGEDPIKKILAITNCPQCGTKGSLRLASRLKPTQVHP